GSTWVRMPSGTGVQLSGVRVRSRDDGVAVGDGGTVLRYDGQDWRAEDAGTGEALLAVCEDGADGAIAVGNRGTLLEFDGRQWRTAPALSGAFLTDVWAGAGLAVAVGDGGTVLERRGGTWRRAETATGAILLAVWGRSRDDVYACGRDGVVIHRDARGWKPLPSPTILTLEGMFGSPAGVWFAGNYGAVLRLQ
ncbi:MAG: hypothetical protein OEY69_07140, partial [Candidatus Krumholzibacteria bacterium]|nr:hypothetical protein [Candidatus Krumholzibacteria bacterium]